MRHGEQIPTNRRRTHFYQDAYAKREYYDVTARYLQTKFNINMDARPDIVKGAVFSYSIQHGQWTAARRQSSSRCPKTVRRTSSSYKLYAYRKNVSGVYRVTTKNFPLHYLYCKKDSGQTKRTYFRTDCCFLLRSRFFPVIMNWISVTLVLCRPE